MSKVVEEMEAFMDEYLQDKDFTEESCKAMAEAIQRGIVKKEQLHKARQEGTLELRKLFGLAMACYIRKKYLEIEAEKARKIK